MVVTKQSLYYGLGTPTHQKYLKMMISKIRKKGTYSMIGNTTAHF